MYRLKAKTFVIIDDDKMTIDFHRHMLEKIGFSNYKTYISAVELLDSIKKNKYRDAIVLCDLRMPEMDGVEFIRKLAENNFLGYLLVVSAVDSKIMKSAITLGRTLGLNIMGGLAKPLKSSGLAQILEKNKYHVIKHQPVVDCNLTKDALISALNSDELFLVYQPKINLKDLSIVGVEALIRWRHPRHGLVSPLTFIEFAESEGLITDVTHRVLHMAFKQLAAWKKRGLYTTMSINVSENDLQCLDFPDYLVSLSEKYDIDLALLTLELTETCLMSDLATSLDVLTRVRLRDIELSIDDYGTGYSTMTKLRHLPFTELKLDQEFIKKIDREQEDYMMIKSNIEMTKNLGLITVAEGIETKEVLAVLQELQCDIGQGYYFSRPLLADDFEAWAKNFNA